MPATAVLCGSWVGVAGGDGVRVAAPGGGGAGRAVGARAIVGDGATSASGVAVGIGVGGGAVGVVGVPAIAPPPQAVNVSKATLTTTARIVRIDRISPDAG